MKRIKNLVGSQWNVGVRLGLSFAFLIVIVICMGWLGLHQMNRADANLENGTARLISVLLIWLAVVFAAAIAVVVTGNTIRDIARRRRAEGALHTAHHELETKLRERTAELKKGPNSTRADQRRLAIVSSILLWFIVVAVGLTFLWSYESTPGVAAAPPNRWPGVSRIKPTPGRATLVMLTHPQCPCTRASIEELDKIMAHCQGRLDAYVVLTRPVGVSDAWVETDLWRRALKIPGVTLVIDQDGIEAQRFRAATSGQVLLYGTDGRLLFSGGITSSRGHVGDNTGESAIESLINTGSANDDHSLVFGCPLFNPDSECRKGSYEEVGN